MVVLSACLTAKSGKPLVARQFVEMSRIRIEGLLAAFPKLINTGKQHTYVETDSVRYVYQPMEALYLLLITNKSSNIMEDLETLRLLAKLVPEFCPDLDEDGVRENSFELIASFDEVMAMGHRENVNIQQVKTALEMESHEEKLHNMIRQSKINEAKEEAKRRAHSIDAQKAARSKGGMGMSGIAGGASLSATAAGMFEDERRSYAPRPEVDSDYGAARKSAPPKGKGMVLGSKGKQSNDVLKAIQAEDALAGLSAPRPSSAAERQRPQAPVSTESVALKVEEKIVVKVAQDGTLEGLEVKGELKMTVNDPEAAYTRVQTHPNINRGLWTEESLLAHRDQAKSFPVGTELGVLKWRLANGPQTLLPLSVTCWASGKGNNASATIEYDSELAASLPLSFVRITVPCSSTPKISDVGEGEARYNSKNEVLEWRIEVIDGSNKTGSIEFSASDVDPSSFFPIQVSFTASGTLSGLVVAGVADARNSKPLPYAASYSLEVEDYAIA